METRNLFYAQSGGVTAVINATACGVIECARRYPGRIGKVLAGHNGILGALREELIDTSLESDATIAALKHTPGGAFGSCRYKLRDPEQQQRQYLRLFDVFRAHHIGYFLYNGGGDSQDTTAKVALMSERLGYPLTCIGIPKTIDNDLPLTDCCPGFGSVAKYIATSTLEASLDIRSMAETSTRVFILEVMGRHAGWIAASAGLAGESPGDPPQIILLPEIPFDPARFLARVQRCVQEQGYCVVVASEGTRFADGRYLAESHQQDAFGHEQLGGVAPALARLIQQSFDYKLHWAVADYLQRSARHLASATDLAQAYAVGEAAVEFALAGQNAVMASIQRDSSIPYRWHIASVPLAQVANQEKRMPAEFITDDGFGITEACRQYLQPLIQGEAFPPFEQGLPRFARLSNRQVPKRLQQTFEL